MCNSPKVVNLHVHSEYSNLDGLMPVSEKTVQRLSEMGQTALAVTDHGTMSAIPSMYHLLKKNGMKLLPGIEAYQSQGKMSDRIKDEKPRHLLMLAENNAGLKNLMQISSLANMEGFYGKPRTDRDVMQKYSDGVITTSGCLASELSQAIMSDNDRLAHDTVAWYKEVYGDRYYFELQTRHTADQKKVNKWLIDNHKRYGVMPIVTTDSHYLMQSDSVTHDSVLCIGTGARLNDAKRMRFDDNTYYLMTFDEMLAYFPDNPEFITNTLHIAERVSDRFESLEFSQYFIPHYDIPDGYVNAQDYLSSLVYRALDEGVLREVVGYEARLQYELGVVEQMGFADYFLLVWDLCQYAKSQGIVWNVRGSGAGSLICWLLGITVLDPIENGLMFERFLNPGRISMPDIDIDYPNNRRAEMVAYTVRRWGVENVAGISAFNVLKRKSAFKDMARVNDIPLSYVNEWSKFLPEDDSEAENSQGFHELYESNPQFANIYDQSLKVVGLVRQGGQHPAGIVITPTPVTDYMPVTRAKDGGVNQVVQYDMDIVEKNGLLKVDFLGLATLNAISQCLKLIEKRYGIKMELGDIPYQHIDDKPDASLDKAFEVFTSGNTAGVFQVESPGMVKVLREMKPTRLKHVIAAVALYRPGPMDFIPEYIARKNGIQEVSYIDPRLESILSETYGVIVYQEQVMMIARDLFNYHPKEVDGLRKSISKKTGDFEVHHQKFLKNGQESGMSVNTIEVIWNQIVSFARYAFNKSHASNYGMVSVITAWLKAHYPLEYMCSLLNAYADDGKQDKIETFLKNLKDNHIPILLPDINLSSGEFTVDYEHSAIRYGLKYIKGSDEKSVDYILSERGDNPFVDVADFFDRVNVGKINKSTLEMLLRLGAFNSIGLTIELGIRAFNGMLEWAKKEKKYSKKQTAMQASLFGSVKIDKPVFVVDEHLDYNVPVPSRVDISTWQEEYLRVKIVEVDDTVHKALTPYNTSKIGAYRGNETANGTGAIWGGVITKSRIHTDKSGREMMFVTLSDHHPNSCEADIVIFASVYSKLSLDVKQALFQKMGAFVFHGKVDTSKMLPSMVMNEVKIIPLD